MRLLALVGVFVATLGFLGYLMTRVAHPEMALFLSHLDPAEGGKIADKLDSLDIPFDIRADGTQIYAPKDKIARLRMEIAQEGLLSSGSMGYEIFDKNDTLGVSAVMLDINKVRALEGELTKSIKSIQGVAQARVHLVLPKRELFSRERNDPSASIMLKMKGVKLRATQVKAIQHLVAAAVPGLNPDKISIVDDMGSLLAKQSDQENAIESISSQQDIKTSYENKTARMIDALLEKSVGSGKVRTEVNVDMDFDKITINSVDFNPEGQVARNVVSSEESGNSTENTADQSASVQNALPNQSGGGASGKNSNQTKRNEESTAYEISNTTKTHIKETGEIKKLSVAVLVDGVYTPSANGQEPTYKERDKKEIDQMITLVKKAIGFNKDRGDTVEIINMKFNAPAEAPQIEESFLEKLLNQYQLGRILEIFITGIIALLALLLVVKPTLLKLIEGGKKGTAENKIILPASKSQTLLGSQDASAMEDNTLVDLVNLQGRVKASTLNKIGAIIEKNPDEAVSIIRNWMYTP